VRWTRTAVPALKLDKNGGAFVDVPAPLPEDSVIARTTDGTLDATGLLQGTLTVAYRGQAALEHRLEAFATDDAGRKKNLEEEISSLLPSGALIELKDAQGWNESEQPLVVHFSLRIPSFAAAAGKRLVAPAFLFQSKPRKIFVSSLRRAPIVFPSSFTELDTVKITLPKGYALEHPPHERKTRLYDASYEILNSFAEDQLTVKRALSLKGVRFGLERYTDLKDFFGVVQAGDEGQAILQLQTGTAEQ